MIQKLLETVYVDVNVPNEDSRSSPAAKEEPLQSAYSFGKRINDEKHHLHSWLSWNFTIGAIWNIQNHLADGALV